MLFYNEDLTKKIKQIFGEDLVESAYIDTMTEQWYKDEVMYALEIEEDTIYSENLDIVIEFKNGNKVTFCVIGEGRLHKQRNLYNIEE